MDCRSCREALSARLDNEDEPGEAATADAHLAGCVTCRQWLESAAVVTRLARTGPAVVAVGVPDSVLDALPAPRRWSRPGLVTLLRLGLGVLGACQFLQGAVQTVTRESTSVTTHNHVGGVTAWVPDHLWNESAAWNLALGAGFLWVALRRGRPAGMLPTLTAFVLALTLLSVADLGAGEVNAARLFGHGFVLAGYLIVLALSRLDPAVDAPPGNRHPGIRQPDVQRSTAGDGVRLLTGARGDLTADGESTRTAQRHGPAAAA